MTARATNGSRPTQRRPPPIASPNRLKRARILSPARPSNSVRDRLADRPDGSIPLRRPRQAVRMTPPGRFERLQVGTEGSAECRGDPIVARGLGPSKPAEEIAEGIGTLVPEEINEG